MQIGNGTNPVTFNPESAVFSVQRDIIVETNTTYNTGSEIYYFTGASPYSIDIQNPAAKINQVNVSSTQMYTLQNTNAVGDINIGTLVSNTSGSDIRVQISDTLKVDNFKS